MPTIVITLADTDTGGVSVKSDFEPRVGNPLSPAQSAALEIIRRTRHEWQVAESKPRFPDPDPGYLMSKEESDFNINRLKSAGPLR